MTSPYFPFYPRDWLLDYKVRCLSWTERAIYFDLLCHMWLDKSCSLPSDDKFLSGILSLTLIKWKKIKIKFFDQLAIFYIQNERVFNTRLLKEFQIMQEKAKKQSENAKKRWGAEGSEAAPDKGNGNSEGMPPHDFGNADAMPSKQSKAEQIQNKADTEQNTNYLALLAKYFPDISLKDVKVFRMFVSWGDAKVIAEDVENAIAYARERGTVAVKPWYFEKAVIDFAKSRLDRSSDEVQTTAGARSQPRFKTREQQIAEHNERVKREFLESDNDEN